MRIIHLIDYFQPQLGYQETYLAREHKKSGHRVTVITSNYYYPFPDYDNTYLKLLGKRILVPGRKQEEGIDTVRLKSVEIPGTPLVLMSGLFETIRGLEPDLVICHGMHSITSYKAALYKKRLENKLIFDSHAANFNTNLDSSILKKLYRFLFRKFAVPEISGGNNSFFAIGEDERDLLANDFHLDKKNIPIIRLGVDTGIFLFSNQARINIRKSLKLKEDDKLIIFTGKIAPNKDVHILVEALNKLRDPKIKLLLVGGGKDEYLKLLQKLILIQGSLLLAGTVKNDKLFQYFSAADMAIWPGNPTISIAEGLSCGKPVILPEFFGTKYLDESKAVIRFQRGNTESLSEKISQLAYNEVLREKMGRMAGDYIRHNLTWKIVAENVLNLIEKNEQY